MDFDTQLIQAASDPLVIAQQSDVVIYVVKSDETRIGAVQEGIGRLINLNANIVGVVLRQVDTKKSAITLIIITAIILIQFMAKRKKVNFSIG